MNWKHGGCEKKKKDPEFAIWCTMKARCTNPNNNRYKNYGARGITFCERWKEYKNFIEDMGKRPSPKLTLERRNNDGYYEPSNCYWGTRKEQGNNTTTNVFLEANNERHTLMQWSEILGINYKAFWFLIRHRKVPLTNLIANKLMYSNKVFITYNGETLNTSQWAKKLNTYRQVFHSKKYKDLPKEKVIEIFYNKQKTVELQ